MKNILLLVLLLPFCASAQEKAAAPVAPSIKHHFYMYWGYNHAAYQNSNISFRGPNYDFTLYDVKALEAVTPFSVGVYLNPGTISIPQYNYRVGYYITDRIGVSIGTDHMKYVVVENQKVHMSGTVSPQASAVYAGSYDNKEVTLSPDFLAFEHTDGLNLVSIDAEYVYPLVRFWKNRISISAEAGAGAGPVIPRTDSRVFGDGLNNYFHLSGFGVDAKVGLKALFGKHFFLQTNVRGGYISLTDILLHNYEPQRAQQNIVFGEWFLVGGVNF